MSLTHWVIEDWIIPRCCFWLRLIYLSVSEEQRRFLLRERLIVTHSILGNIAPCRPLVHHTWPPARAKRCNTDGAPADFCNESNGLPMAEESQTHTHTLPISHRALGRKYHFPPPTSTAQVLAHISTSRKDKNTFMNQTDTQLLHPGNYRTTAEKQIARKTSQQWETEYSEKKSCN